MIISIFSYCRLAPPPVEIGLDGGYTNILVRLEAGLCGHEARDTGACAGNMVTALQVGGENNCVSFFWEKTRRSQDRQCALCSDESKDT